MTASTDHDDHRNDDDLSLAMRRLKREMSAAGIPTEDLHLVRGSKKDGRAFRLFNKDRVTGGLRNVEGVGSHLAMTERKTLIALDFLAKGISITRAQGEARPRPAAPSAVGELASLAGCLTPASAVSAGATLLLETEAMWRWIRESDGGDEKVCDYAVLRLLAASKVPEDFDLRWQAYVDLNGRSYRDPDGGALDTLVSILYRLLVALTARDRDQS